MRVRSASREDDGSYRAERCLRAATIFAVVRGEFALRRRVRTNATSSSVNRTVPLSDIQPKLLAPRTTNRHVRHAIWQRTCRNRGSIDGIRVLLPDTPPPAAA